MKIEKNLHKNEIRKIAEKIRDAIPIKEKDEKDRIIQKHLFNWELYKKSNYLFCYVSFRSEVDTFEIIRRSITQGKVVAVPKIFPKRKIMKAFVIKSIDKSLRPGEYGILEPIDECPEADYSKLDLIIAPGLAFTEKGERLGYGGGYYDRFLSKYPEIPVCALTYEALITDSLPVKENDIAVDYLITEKGIKITKKGIYYE